MPPGGLSADSGLGPSSGAAGGRAGPSLSAQGRALVGEAMGEAWGGGVSEKVRGRFMTTEPEEVGGGCAGVSRKKRNFLREDCGDRGVACSEGSPGPVPPGAWDSGWSTLLAAPTEI